MNYLKKHWYLFIIALLTIGLAVLVALTSGKLSQTKQVAPTVPQAEPQAAVTACKLTFTINIGPTPTGTLTPTPTPTNTPTPTPTATPIPTNTPTPTPTATPIPTNTPTPTPTATPIPTATPMPTNTPTPTPQPQAGCNNTCTVNSDCQSGLVCISNSCRNASCTEQTNCQCQTAYNAPTATPVPPAGCSNSCTLNADCTDGLVCVGGMCLNASCTSETNCVCPVASAAQPTPKIPVSGTGFSILGATIIGSGLLILLLGLAL